MQKILLLVLAIGATSCAQLVQNAKSTLMKGKYEKGLEYKEGELVDIKISGTFLASSSLKKAAKSKSKLIDDYKKRGELVTRYGLEGNRTQLIKNMIIPISWVSTLDKASVSKYNMSRNAKELSLKAKVIKVDRKCEPDHGTMSKCINGSMFEDTLQFLKWTNNTTNSMSNYVSRLKAELLNKNRLRLAEEKENKRIARESSPTFIRAKYPKQARKCDGYLSKIDKLKAKMRVPAQSKNKRVKLIEANEDLIEQTTSCFTSNMYTEKQSDNFLYFSKCVQYYAIGSAGYGGFCN